MGPFLAAALGLARAVAVWPHANLCRTVTGGARRGTWEARAAESCPLSVFFYLKHYFAIKLGPQKNAVPPAAA
jgi:hypothetical protein